MAKQLTLSQPGGQIRPTTIIQAPPYFQTLRRTCATALPKVYSFSSVSNWATYMLYLKFTLLIRATVIEISPHIEQSADFCTTVKRLVDYKHQDQISTTLACNQQSKFKKKSRVHSFLNSE